MEPSDDAQQTSARSQAVGIDDIAEGEATMKANWRDHIVTSPDVLRGKPRIRGTRVPVSLILGYLAACYTDDEIIAEFPDLKADDILACLDYARELSEIEVAIP